MFACTCTPMPLLVLWMYRCASQYFRCLSQALRSVRSGDQAFALAKRVREAHPFGAFRLARKALQLTATHLGDWMAYTYSECAPHPAV